MRTAASSTRRPRARRRHRDHPGVRHHQQTGYCEQFAASMALMARTLGIPSRVAVGFLRPSGRATSTLPRHRHARLARAVLRRRRLAAVRADSGQLDRRRRPDVHRRAGQRTEPTLPASTTPSAGDRTRTSGLRSAAGGRGCIEWGRRRRRDGVDRPERRPGAAGAASGWPSRPGSPAPLCAGGAGPGQADGAAEPAWQELRDSTVDLGLAFDDRATLRAAGHGLRTHLGGQQQAIDALNRLVVRVEQARFARAGRGSRDGRRRPAGSSRRRHRARRAGGRTQPPAAAARHLAAAVTVCRRVRGDCAGAA